VAAAVTETRQGIVFGEDPDARLRTAPAACPCRTHRSREPAGRVLRGIPVATECLGDEARRLMLLERGLGVRVDPVRELDDLVAGGLDSCGDPSLRVGVRLRGTRGRKGSGHESLPSINVRRKGLLRRRR
jgi:hypothetical protein